MMTGKDAPSTAGWKVQDIRWAPVGLGFVLGLLGTLVVGLPLLVITDDSWLMAIAGSAGLLVGGLVAGRMMGASLAVVNGALIAILYNLTVSLVFFAGSFLQILPEPLPGLPQGDSTFFFAWPLVQFAIAIFGSIMGSRMAAAPRRRS